MKNADKPAFPYTDGESFAYDGLTKREEFAKAAMQGMLSSSMDYIHQMSSAQLAVFSVFLADELLKQLENEH